VPVRDGADHLLPGELGPQGGARIAPDACEPALGEASPEEPLDRLRYDVPQGAERPLEPLLVFAGELVEELVEDGVERRSLGARGRYGRIDLLVTDVVMPGMNGGELATQLILHRPEMKVLFTSGYAENVIVHHGVMDDEVSFLGKPYSPSALAKKIREVLDRVG
jgi:CheY-like chemotaxis protein